jgi:hypothetical protein
LNEIEIGHRSLDNGRRRPRHGARLSRLASRE